MQKIQNTIFCNHEVIISICGIGSGFTASIFGMSFPEITGTANDNLLRGYLVKNSELHSRNLLPATVETIQQHH
jgi:hypothetical protein